MNDTQKFFAICGIIGPIIYVIVLTVLGLLWSGYNPVTQYMSELGAVDAPHSTIMNVLGFQLLGIFMIAFGFGLYRGLSKGWTSRIGIAIIIVGGISLIAVGFFPCDSGCINVSPIGVGHMITATMSSISFTVGMLITSLSLRKDSRWQSYWIFTMTFSIVAILISPLPMFPPFKTWAGLLQRIGIGLPLFWMVVMGIKLLRLSTRLKT